MRGIFQWRPGVVLAGIHVVICVPQILLEESRLRLLIRRLGMFQRFPMIRVIFLLCLLVPAAKAQFFGGKPIGGSNGPVACFPGPQSYRDPATGIIFYVESDGLHVAAISKEGKILWVKDPFHDAKLSDYRTHNPQIVWIGKGSWWANGVRQKDVPAIEIIFNSSQFGAMKISDGDFQYQGRN